jgi:hypothetical protein
MLLRFGSNKPFALTGITVSIASRPIEIMFFSPVTAQETAFKHTCLLAFEFVSRNADYLTAAYVKVYRRTV